jgi:lysophospholipase L1-like esterase
MGKVTSRIMSKDMIDSMNKASMNNINSTTTYFSNTKNVFNKSEQVAPNIIDESYLNASGVVGAIAGYYISSFIPVKSSTQYVLTNKEASQGFLGGWYDSNKQWLANIELVGNIIGTAPSNATYVRLNINKTVDIDTIYFQEINEYYKDSYKGKKVNFLGDSITYGAGTTKAYHSYLNDILNFGVVRNYGLSGSNIARVSGDTSSFEYRYKTMETDADIVFIFGGVNDWINTITAPIGTSTDRVTGTLYGGLHVLISGVLKKFLDKKVYFLTPLHTGNETTPNSVTNKTLSQYVDIIKEVCKFYGVPVIDLYSECVMRNEPVLGFLYGYDDIHPNERGHKNIADVILRNL